MALVLKDRVKVTTTTAGTGTLSLSSSPVTGYQSFDAIGNGNTCYYAISSQGGSEWEVGLGTYSSSGPTLSRDTILSSSAAGAVVDLSAGTKEVYVVYPAEKAIYEESNGTTVFNGGPITVVGPNVTSYTQFTETLSQMYANTNNFAQSYVQNLNDGVEASADFAAYNDRSDGSTYFVDMGISSSNGSSSFYPILAANAGYVISYGDGGSNVSDLYLGSGDGKVTVFAGSFNPNSAVAVFNTDLSTELKGSLDVPGALTVDNAATFGSTVTLNASPTQPLQAATKQYVDQVASAGLHIHDPVLVETTGNLNATYAQGGTTFNITDITSGTTVTTSTTHGLSVNDQIWLTTSAGNGLSTNTAYFVFSVPANNQLTLSLTFGGVQITGLTNASGLSYATRANSGVGATLTNAGTQAALTIDGVALSLNDRVMVRLQTNAAENGVYTVTNVGSGSTNWVLTRATDANKVNPGDPDGLGTGDYFYTEDGDLNAGDSHVLTTEPNTMIIGYTSLTYTLFSAVPTFTGGTNINVSGQTISLTGTVAPTNGGTGVNTVTTGDILYGSATNTWAKLPKGAAYRSLVMDASGTNVEWNAVSLNQAGAVSGSLGPTNGGTGQSGYTTGDILYSSATNTLAKLAGNTTTTKKFLGQTGTGSASQAPVWAQPAASDITGLAPSATTDTTNASNITSGTLANARTTATANNGANTIVARDASGNFAAAGISATTFSGDGANLTSLNGTAITTGTVANARTTASSSNGANTIVARDASGNFAAATITATAFSGSYSGSGANLTNLNASAITTGTIDNARTSASTTNSANTIVARDASGNFSAGTITATLNGNASTVTNGLYTSGSQTVTGVKSFNSSNTGMANAAGGLANLEAIGTGGGAFMSFHRPGVYAAYFGLDSDNVWKVGGWSTGGVAYPILTSNNYNSYSPTLTGGGASGTWGISITGNANNVSGTVAIGNGGTGASDAGTARTNLGATTLGSNLFTITNPSAVTFPQFNADNTVSSLDAATFRSAIGAGTGNGNGTVTSVSGTGSANGLSLSGTVTSSGSITLSGSVTSVSTSGNFQMNSLGVGTAGSGTAGEIRATNNVTAYFSSDAKYKENVRPIDGALDKVVAIGGKYFDWKDSYIAEHGGEDGYFVQKSDFGVIAQDVQAVFPKAVRTRPDGSLAVDYEKLSALAFAAIVELKAEIDKLKGR